MPYNSPANINATKGLSEIFNYVNNVTDGWISNLILVGIFLIILIGYYKARDDFKGALAVSGFGTFVIGLLFWAGDFVSGWALGITIAITLVGIIVLMTDKSQ